MGSLSERQIVRRAALKFAELLHSAVDEVYYERSLGDGRADLILRAVGHTFVLECKSSGAAGPVANAAEKVRQYAAKARKKMIPLVVVPYMGEVGRERCKDAGVGWFDLSGNAHIVAPGLRIIVEGRPNQFKRPGRPSSAFAPRASRIARWLLIHEGEFMSQRDIARATGMDEGYTSRVVARLHDDHLLERNEDGAVRARDPNLLLDAWREAYDFGKHDLLTGHIAARSGGALMNNLADVLRDQGGAITGLGAAWLLTHFAGFRLVTAYLREPPEPAFLDRIGFRQEERGANVWLVVPNDEGVFHGEALQDGIPCVHPVQVYLDLAAQPERAEDAAAELRSRFLTWRGDD